MMARITEIRPQAGNNCNYLLYDERNEWVHSGNNKKKYMCLRGIGTQPPSELLDAQPALKGITV